MGKGGTTKQVPGAVPKWKGKATIVNVEGNGKGRDGIVTMRATVKAEMSIAAAMYHLYEAYIAVGPEACDAMDWEECFKKYFVRKDGDDGKPTKTMARLWPRWLRPRSLSVKKLTAATMAAPPYVGIEPLAIVIKPLTLAVYVRR